jgi:hypothetical protein
MVGMVGWRMDYKELWGKVGSTRYRVRGTEYKSMVVGVMMTSMRESMNRHSTEVWEMVGSMGYKMDYKEV